MDFNTLFKSLNQNKSNAILALFAISIGVLYAKQIVNENENRRFYKIGLQKIESLHNNCEKEKKEMQRLIMYKDSIRTEDFIKLYNEAKAVKEKTQDLSNEFANKFNKLKTKIK